MWWCWPVTQSPNCSREDTSLPAVMWTWRVRASPLRYGLAPLNRTSAAKRTSNARSGPPERSQSPPVRAASGSAACSRARGIADLLGPRIVKAPPGVPVGRLVALGDAELGFQQLSELVHLDGIDVLGPLPPTIRITTTFTAAVGTRARQPALARELTAFLAGPSAAGVKRQEGMEPASTTPTRTQVVIVGAGPRGYFSANCWPGRESTR